MTTATSRRIVGLLAVTPVLAIVIYLLRGMLAVPAARCLTLKDPALTW